MVLVLLALGRGGGLCKLELAPSGKYDENLAAARVGIPALGLIPKALRSFRIYT